MHSGVLATAEKLPRGHSLQVAAPVPFTPVALPAGHVRHLLSVALAGFQVPGLQATQPVAPAPPAATVMAPGLHGVQESDLGFAEKEPAGQVLHVWEPSPEANSPASLQQGRQRNKVDRGVMDAYARMARFGGVS